VTRARVAGLTAGAALLVLGFYLLVYPLHGHRVALGSDTPVYIWWTRYAGSTGIGDLGTGSRSGLVAAMATLSTVTGVSVDDLAAVLGPVLAVAAGLAAGAVVTSAFGVAPGRAALTVVLCGTFLSLLVPGYFSTLGFGAVFVAGLAALAAGLDGRRRSPVVAAALLFGAAGLFHALFLAVAAVILAGGLIALIPSSRREVAGGASWPHTPVGLAVGASAGGAAVAAAGLGLGGGLLGGLTEPAIVTARDTVLRRTGLTELLQDSYRAKLRHDFPWYRAVLVPAVALLPFGRADARASMPTSRRAWANQSPGRALFWGTVASWIAVTVGGVVALGAGFGVPGQRLAAFCVALPMMGAVGVWAVWTEASRAIRVAAGAGVALFVVVAWMAWNGEPALIGETAATQVRAAGSAVASQPRGTPVVLVSDDRSDRSGRYVVRNLNYLRAAVPGGRVPDVLAFVGGPADLVSRRPGLTGDPEHDAMSRAFWEEVRPRLDGSPLALSIRGFDPRGFREASALPGATVIGPGVVALPGYAGTPCGGPCHPTRPSLSEPATLTFSPWVPLWVGPPILALLALLGAGWVRLALPRADPGTAVGLSPAFGLAGLALAGVTVDALGLRLGSAGGWLTAALALFGGIAATVLVRRRRSA
jgi:hypothetical protein